MKAKTVLKETISTALEGNSLDNVVTRGSGFKNLLNTFIRKLTSQKFRINIPSYTSIFRKVFYYSKILSIDYLNYVYEKNPDIPAELLGKRQKRSIVFSKNLFYFSL